VVFLKIDVTFDIDANGILNVTAVEKSTGKEQKITIKNDKGRMSAEEIERLVQEAERYKAQDEAHRARVESKNALENYVFQLKNSMNEEKLAAAIPAGDKETINEALKETQSWLDAHQSAEKEEYEEKQKSLEAKVMPILSKISGGAGGAPGGMPGGFPGGMPGGFGGAAPAGGAAPSGGNDDGPKIEEID